MTTDYTTPKTGNSSTVNERVSYLEFTQDKLVRVYEDKSLPKQRKAKQVTQRTLTVRQGWYDYQAKQTYQQRATIAEILLKGKWLTEAGFIIGQTVNVDIQQGKLVITNP